MHILLTGGGGFIGRHLAPYLAEKGHRVMTLRRNATSVADGDWKGPTRLKEIEDWPDWPAGVEAIVHLAAANPARGQAGANDAALLREVNVEGTAALARRSAREGVRRFVFLSSANVHAPRPDGKPITEGDALRPQSAYAASKAEAEATLRSALAETATQFCILRPAPVFGRGGRGTVAQLARLAATPLPLPFRGLGGPRSLLAVEDLIRAIALALTAPGAAGATLLLAGGAATPAELVAALRKGNGRRPLLAPAPAALLGGVARALGKGAAWASLTHPFVVDWSEAKGTLGWSPRVGLLDRLAAHA
jgi:UDP-glucose 4-epimerase